MTQNRTSTTKILLVRGLKNHAVMPCPYTPPLHHPIKKGAKRAFLALPKLARSRILESENVQQTPE
jgi:hypothetical protein